MGVGGVVVVAVVEVEVAVVVKAGEGVVANRSGVKQAFAYDQQLTV